MKGTVNWEKDIDYHARRMAILISFSIFWRLVLFGRLLEWCECCIFVVPHVANEACFSSS